MKSQNKRYWQHQSWGTERLYYWSHFLWEKGFTRVAKIVKFLNMLAFRAYIDCQAQIGERLDMPHGGMGVVIGPEVHIGSDAIIMHNVTIGHAKPGPVVIGDRFYAGTAAIIIGPLTIGSDVTIGANTLVNFDVPDGATVVSQKARIIIPAEKTVDRVSQVAQ